MGSVPSSFHGLPGAQGCIATSTNSRTKGHAIGPKGGWEGDNHHVELLLTARRATTGDLLIFATQCCSYGSGLYLEAEAETVGST